MREFNREIQARLLQWKNGPNRKPLVLQGARQVGKTHLLKQLGNTAFTEMAYFNFEEQPTLKQLFENTKDVQHIIQNLSLVYGRPILPNTTLLVLDEVQECNAALNTLKYFYENAPQYAVAAAGSLLGITLSTPGSFPVGKVHFMEVYPLSFMEYLQAANPTLHQYVQQLTTLAPMPDIFFTALQAHFRHYSISGGMPEAMATLLPTVDVQATESILKDILQAYSLDFAKHAPTKEIARINHVWQSIPAQLARENKKFLYQTVKTGARAREYEDALLWLLQAGLIYKVPLCKKPHLPLSAYDDLSAFKIYLADVGLLRKLAQLPPNALENTQSLFTEFKGALAENYVLQSLARQFEVAPRYWTSAGNAEVDFLLHYKNEVLPCEVKAGLNTRSQSLSVYQSAYQPPLRIRYSLKNLDYNDGLLNIPLFLADRTQQFLVAAGL
ncbi:MAG: ATP-binding protein [Bacteroidetes bacterium]|nr:MAG: ATP-binding protein [Bacteroidota bacterium]